MENRFERTQRVLGKAAIKLLEKKHVMVLGLGGVGGACVEALARGAVGSLSIVDNDTVNRTNINRQLIASEATVGMKKTDAAELRIKGINPEIKIKKFPMFITRENAGELISDELDYVVDCIDNVTAKLEIYKLCQEKNIPIISSMGTGNKIYPEMFEIADIEKTSVCPLCRVIRKECRDRGLKKIKVLYSKEEPRYAYKAERTPGSVSFVPPVAGMMLAGYVIRNLLNIEE